MPDLSGLVQAGKHANTLASWLESGSLADLLADVEFEAARASLSKARLAIDAKSQVWNAVGHLETCYQSLLNIVKSHRWWHNTSLIRNARTRQARDKARFVLCLIAACYSYLGERKLCEQHLDQIKNIPEMDEGILGAVVGLGTAMTVGPFQALYGATTDKGEVSYNVSELQVDELRIALLRRL